MKPALSGTRIRRKPVFTGKLLQFWGAELQRLHEKEPVFRGGNFGPSQFRCRQVLLVRAVVMYSFFSFVPGEYLQPEVITHAL